MELGLIIAGGVFLGLIAFYFGIPLFLSLILSVAKKIDEREEKKQKPLTEEQEEQRVKKQISKMNRKSDLELLIGFCLFVLSLGFYWVVLFGD